jgi:hypothetical protein
MNSSMSVPSLLLTGVSNGTEFATGVAMIPYPRDCQQASIINSFAVQAAGMLWRGTGNGDTRVITHQTPFLIPAYLI